MLPNTSRSRWVLETPKAARATHAHHVLSALLAVTESLIQGNKTYINLTQPSIARQASHGIVSPARQRGFHRHLHISHSDRFGNELDVEWKSHWCETPEFLKEQYNKKKSPCRTIHIGINGLTWWCNWPFSLNLHGAPLTLLAGCSVNWFTWSSSFLKFLINSR